MNTSIRHINHWVFDLDGTLTNPIHDFDHIRAQLDIPNGAPILEYIESLPEGAQATLNRKLDKIELLLADQASLQNGADRLLNLLRRKNCSLGIVTRNNLECTLRTLQAVGLADYFSPDTIVSRDCAAPKPSPEGIEQLLDQWRADPKEAVMVGDYLYDLQAGKAAGLTTIHLDSRQGDGWPHVTDIRVDQLQQIVRLMS